VSFGPQFREGSGAGRLDLEDALTVAIIQCINDRLKGKMENSCVVSGASDWVTQLDALKELVGDRQILFVVDEASALLNRHTINGVSYYHSLRAAFKRFQDMTRNLFFVVMATISDVTYLSPGVHMDPSF